MNNDIAWLNVYQKVCKPRIKTKSADSSVKSDGLSQEAFNAFLEMWKCPICLTFMKDPVMSTTCYHKFWKEWIESVISSKKKECPVWRVMLGWRRLLVKDTKVESIISKLIPNPEDYFIYEQSEVKRYLHSKDNKKKLKEFKKIQKAQIAKIEKIKRDKIKEKEKRKERKRDKKERSKARHVK